MKKTSISLLLCILFSISFFSCTSKTVKTEEKDLSKKFYLDKDTTAGSLHLDFQVELPIAYCDSNILRSVHDSVVLYLFGSDYLHTPKEKLLETVANDFYESFVDDNKAVINIKDTIAGYTLKYKNVVSGFSLLSDKRLYVYGVERYIYMGGAHGNETRFYLNFDLTSGKTIKEPDIFNQGYEKNLTEVIKKQILEICKSAPREKNSEAIETLDDTDFWVDAIKPNGNFYVTDESINYVFNPYEIAPYSMGQTEVIIPFDKLYNILKNESAITHLVDKYRQTQKS